MPARPVRVVEHPETSPAKALVEPRRLPAIAVERGPRAAAPHRLGLDLGHQLATDAPAPPFGLDPDAPDLDQPHIDDAPPGREQAAPVNERDGVGLPIPVGLLPVPALEAADDIGIELVIARDQLEIEDAHLSPFRAEARLAARSMRA